VIEFIKFLPQKGGNKKARQGTGLGDGHWADNAVYVAVNALSELRLAVGPSQISRSICS
jgi:hypothetical protein